MPVGTVAPAVAGARRRLKILFVLMALFTGWALYTLYLQQDQIRERTVERRQSETRLTDAVKTNEQLQLQITRLGDDEYISQIARKEYGLSYPGEYAIRIGKTGE